MPTPAPPPRGASPWMALPEDGSRPAFRAREAAEECEGNGKGEGAPLFAPVDGADVTEHRVGEPVLPPTVRAPVSHYCRERRRTGAPTRVVGSPGEGSRRPAASGWSHARRGLPDRSGVAECTRYGASTRGAGPARPARPSPGGPGRVHAPSGSRIGEFPAVLVSGCALAPSDPRSGSDASRKAGCERARLARSPIRAGRRARVVFTGGGSERGCDV